MKLALSILPLAARVFADEYSTAQIPLEEEAALPASFQSQHDPIGPLIIDAIPLIGFGTWRLKENCSEAVSWAIQTGYTHIDCAAVYGNEEEVGRGIRDGLAKTGKTRDELWITSKLWNDHHDPRKVEEAIDESLAKLGVGYLNLYLMHWPVAQSPFGLNAIEYTDTWKAMGKLVDKKKTNHIGVANFSPYEIDQLLKLDSHPPQVHQMELHPYLQQTEFIEWHADRNIHVTAYSPLAGTNPIYDPGAPVPLLFNSVITEIADKRDCTPAQVAIKWSMSRGTSVIPKSSHNNRITENFYSLGCILKDQDIEKINELGKERYRFSNPSKSWGVPLYEGLEDSKGNHEKHS